MENKCYNNFATAVAKLGNNRRSLDDSITRKPVKELANFVASFANASGGTLVIGIADDGKIEGFEDYPSKYNDFLKVTSIDYLKTIPNYKNETLEVINYKGNKDKILLIHIQPSTDILIRNVKDEVYLRQGDSSNKLSSEQIRILNRLEEKNLIEWIGTSVSDPKKVYTVKQKNEKMSQ